MHIVSLQRSADLLWIVIVHVQQHQPAVLHHLWQWFCQRGTCKGCRPNGWLSSQPADLRYVRLSITRPPHGSLTNFLKPHATRFLAVWCLHPYRASWVSAGKHLHHQAPRPSGSPYTRATSGMNHSWPSISRASKTCPRLPQRNPEGFSPWVCQQCHHCEFPELIVCPRQAQPTLLSTRVRSTIKMSNPSSRTPPRIGLSPSRT